MSIFVSESKSLRTVGEYSVFKPCVLAALICICIRIYLSIYPQGKRRRIIMRIHRQSGTEEQMLVNFFFIKRRGGERKRFPPKEKCSRWINYSLFHYNKVFFSVRVIYPQPFLLLNLYFLKNTMHAVLWIHLKILIFKRDLNLP